MNSCSARPAASLKPLLLTLLAIGITCFSHFAAAQLSLPSPPRTNPSASNTVSITQLLSSEKEIRSVSRARRFLIDEKLDKAQAEISRVLHEYPDCAAAHDIQGAIRMRQRDFDGAADEFTKAINADPTIAQAYLGLGIVLIARSHFKEALLPLDRAEALLPSSWLVYFETAIAHLQLGDSDSALKQLTTAQMLAGPDAEKRSGTAYLQALALLSRKDLRAAAQHLKDAIRFDPAGLYAKPAQAKIEELEPLFDSGKEELAKNDKHP